MDTSPGGDIPYMVHSAHINPSISFGTYTDGPQGHRCIIRIVFLWYNIYSIFVVDNKHANHGLQCSSLLTYTLVVQKIALYRSGGAQAVFACSLWTTREMMYNAVLSVSVPIPC